MGLSDIIVLKEDILPSQLCEWEGIKSWKRKRVTCLHRYRRNFRKRAF